MARRKKQTHDGVTCSNVRLNTIIREYLVALKSGYAPSPEQLIQANSDLAEELRMYFRQEEGLTQSIDAAAIETDAAAEETKAYAAAYSEPETLPHENDQQSLISSSKFDTQAETQFPSGSSSSGSVPDASKTRAASEFGEYDLLEEIARGGMGVVFKARQRALDRTVALKMILAGEFAGDAAVQRFHTEAEAAARLDHSGIVPIFEIGEHAGQHFFSMAYIEGKSLAQKIAAGPLASREAAELVMQICEAIAYAHDHGVIHRDLKPANILIDSRGQPKVTDFGLAKKTETDSDLTGTGQILGTPAYMPPEQAAGKIDQVGPLADVYSLGAILYSELTGRPPFQSATVTDTLMQVLEREPVPPRQLDPQIDRDLETICLKCLEKPPSNRYPSAHSLAEDLGRFLRDEPIKARPPRFHERAVRWARNHVALVTTIMLLLATSAIMLPLTFAVPNMGVTGVAREHEATQLMMKEMQRMIAQDPKNAAAHSELGHAYLKQDELDHAIERFSAAIRLDDTKWRYHLQRGSAFVDKEQFQLAIEDLTKAIKLDATSAEAFYQRARARYGLDDFQKCLEDLNQAISTRPGFAEAYVLRGRVFSQLGNATSSRRDRETVERLGHE